MLFTPLFMLLAFYGLEFGRRFSVVQLSRPTVRRLKVVGTAIIDWTSCMMLTTAVTLGSCYLFARAYVLLESFMGLRSVYERVYEVVQWTAWWPHA
jgi:hypothetical protein